MKKTLLSLAILTSFAAQADEGMWMPQQLPQVAKQLKAAGLKLDPANLTKLTEFPMGAIVSLGGCSASFVSPQGLVVTNHHCVYNSIAVNSTPERDLLANGFLAKTMADELPASPGSRVYVTDEVANVSAQVITPEVAKLTGKARIDAIEKNQKTLVAACEKDAGYRCTVASFYGGLEFYRLKQLEIRDVRLVHAPASGVGKFGGDTDNWMWPRHTGDYGFYRAYVSKDGKSAEFSKDNVPYQPKHIIKIAKDNPKEGDFVMVLGYPGRTNRHRLPSEVAFTFDWNYPAFIQASSETLAIIDRETKTDPA
ncbi:MAG: S46 family peptidase, partial [Massilia sp.]